jgi:type VI secretion system secreted protein Hcp
MPIESALFYDDALGIKGSNTKKGRADSSVVIQLDHEVFTPVEEQRGVVTGARVHRPVNLLKEIDTASAGLYQACCEGKTIPKLTVKWYEIDGTSADEVEHFHTILEGVKVVSVVQRLPNSKEEAEAKKRHLEELKLMYEKITWKHLAGFEFTDMWKEA